MDHPISKSIADFCNYRLVVLKKKVIGHSLKTTRPRDVEGDFNTFLLDVIRINIEIAAARCAKIIRTINAAKTEGAISDHRNAQLPYADGHK